MPHPDYQVWSGTQKKDTIFEGRVLFVMTCGNILDWNCGWSNQLDVNNQIKMFVHFQSWKERIQMYNIHLKSMFFFVIQQNPVWSSSAALKWSACVTTWWEDMSPNHRFLPMFGVSTETLNTVLLFPWAKVYGKHTKVKCRYDVRCKSLRRW